MDRRNTWTSLFALPDARAISDHTVMEVKGIQIVAGYLNCENFWSELLVICWNIAWRKGETKRFSYFLSSIVIDKGQIPKTNKNTPWQNYLLSYSKNSSQRKAKSLLWRTPFPSVNKANRSYILLKTWYNQNFLWLMIKDWTTSFISTVKTEFHKNQIYCFIL